MTEDNNSIGKFHLAGIQPAHRGLPQAWCSPTILVAKIKFLVAETLRGVGGLVFVAHGNRFANELGRRNCVTGEMWKDKLPFRLSFGSASITLDVES